MVIILMMSGKMATPEFLNITVFLNKCYDAIIHVDDATSNILSRDSNYIVDVFMWPKFGNYSNSKLWQLQFYKDFPKKPIFFEKCDWFKFNNLGMALGKNLKFCTSAEKVFKLAVRKFWRPVPTFVEVAGEKLVGVAFPPHHSE